MTSSLAHTRSLRLCHLLRQPVQVQVKANVLPKHSPCVSPRLTFLLTNWKAEHFLKEKADFSPPPPPPPPPFTSFMADTGAPLASLDPRVTDRLAKQRDLFKASGREEMQRRKMREMLLQKGDAGEWVHGEVPKKHRGSEAGCCS